MKYDWSKVPNSVICITTDKNGVVKGFEGKPYKSQTGFGSSYGYFLLKDVKPYVGFWSDSVEFLPNAEWLDAWRKDYE